MFQIIINGIIAGSIYALIALGFTIIYRTVKFFHFAHGAVYSIGAYCAFTMLHTFRINLVASFFLSICFASTIGVLIEQFVYRPLRLKNASNLIYLLASFGVFILIQNLIQLLYGARVLTIRLGPVREGREFLGAVITDIQLIVLVFSFAIMSLLWLFLNRSKLGKAMRAVADDPIAANIVGINPQRIIQMVFATGSALAGAAGILISLETNLEPSMGFIALLKGIIASIVGGIGSVPGAVLGAFFLGLTENFGIWKLDAGWKDSIGFAILIIFLMIRPQGILGSKTEAI